MLTSMRENKSIYVISKNADGEEVFAANASYSSRSVSITFEMLNEAYCSTHKSEVEEAITAFLNRFNGVLALDELPQVNC